VSFVVHQVNLVQFVHLRKTPDASRFSRV
jgi:hypothetical protein